MVGKHMGLDPLLTLWRVYPSLLELLLVLMMDLSSSCLSLHGHLLIVILYLLYSSFHGNPTAFTSFSSLFTRSYLTLPCRCLPPAPPVFFNTLLPPSLISFSYNCATYIFFPLLDICHFPILSYYHLLPSATICYHLRPSTSS